MALYLDSFNFADWHELMPSNVFHGITTNPLLAKRAGLLYGDIEWHAVIERAAKCGAKELHIQVPHTDASVIDFVAARKAEAAHANLTIVIKIPLTDAGILLASNVKALEMPILMTACYHAKQYLIADALKAAFIAPYYGRMDEASVAAIEAVTSVPLVIHGGSGVPAEQRRRLAQNTAICKFNIGTELRMAFGKALREAIGRDDARFDRVEILKETIDPVETAARHVLRCLKP